MGLALNITLLLLGISILVWGANKFVDHASVIAKHLGVGDLVIGLTLIAAGTSAPEIFVAISAVINGNENIEFLIEQLGDSSLNYKVFNTYIKFNDISNYFTNDMNYDFSNIEKYENPYLNLTPSFIDPFNNDLRIDQNSELLNLGNISFAELTPFDILNFNRLNSPDLGAYQHIIIQD